MAEDSHVQDAFRFRKFLVELKYAQHRYVVAVDSTEARDDAAALAVALKRAGTVLKNHGDLITSYVTTDTPSARTSLNADGAAWDVEMAHLSRRAAHWYNCESLLPSLALTHTKKPIAQDEWAMAYAS